MNDHTKEYCCKLKTFSRRKYLYYINHLAKTKKYNLSHITYYASNNVGDTVLSNTVRRGFEQYFKEIKWELFDVSNPVNSDTVCAFNSLDALIIGGGGLFLPDTNRNRISGWQWPCSAEKLHEINRPIILYAVGFNYFRGQSVDDLFIRSIHDIIEKSAFIGLRNHGSIREVKKLLPEHLQDKLVYQPCLTTIIRKLGYNLPPKMVNRTVAVNLAFDRIEQRLGDKKQQILGEIADAIKDIEAKGYDIYYIAHIVKDLGFMDYLKKRSVRVRTIVASSWSTNKLINFYNDMDVVIGMRGHAQMIPFGVNCHIITLGSHDKMKWFLEDIDTLDWYVELAEADKGLSKSIVEKFVKIHEQDEKLTTQRLLEAQEKLYEITQNNFEQISSVLKSFQK